MSTPHPGQQYLEPADLADGNAVRGRLVAIEAEFQNAEDATDALPRLRSFLESDSVPDSQSFDPYVGGGGVATVRGPLAVEWPRVEVLRQAVERSTGASSVGFTDFGHGNMLSFNPTYSGAGDVIPTGTDENGWPEYGVDYSGIIARESGEVVARTTGAIGETVGSALRGTVGGLTSGLGVVGTIVLVVVILLVLAVLLFVVTKNPAALGLAAGV